MTFSNTYTMSYLHSTHIQVSHTFTVHTLSWPSPIHYVSLTLTLIETDPLNVLEHCEHHDVQFIGTHIGHILSQRQWHGQRVGMAVIRGVGSAWIEAASWSWYKGGDERRGSPFPCQTLCPLMTSHGAPLLLHHVSQAERPNKQTQWYRLTNKHDKTYTSVHIDELVTAWGTGTYSLPPLPSDWQKISWCIEEMYRWVDDKDMRDLCWNGMRIRHIVYPIVVCR